jgi:hypothetical protein
MNTMSIDPSVRSCGWAIWKGKKLKDFGVFRPASSREKDWQEAGREVGDMASAKGKHWEVERVFCEFPAYFGDNVTAKSGSLVKLAWFVGFLDGLFTEGLTEFELVPVHVWKGQLPKTVVNARIERLLSKKICNRLRSMPPDAWDAVGIGLFKHGRML